MPTETVFCSIVKALCPHNIIEKLCPECVSSVGICWKCQAELSFVVPRRGYSTELGCCSSCDTSHWMLSNYGLVTLFPVDVFMNEINSKKDLV